jgi:hypothetical protein
MGIARGLANGLVGGQGIGLQGLALRGNAPVPMQPLKER